MKLLKSVKYIVIHCSDSHYGCADMIDGYHFVIGNGHRRVNGAYNAEADGELEFGRSTELQGAHCFGLNRVSLGICIVGGRDRSGRSQFGEPWMSRKQENMLFSLLAKLQFEHPDAKVIGHYERNPFKTCPNIDMRWVRTRLNRFSGMLAQPVEA